MQALHEWHGFPFPSQETWIFKSRLKHNQLDSRTSETLSPRIKLLTCSLQSFLPVPNKLCTNCNTPHLQTTETPIMHLHEISLRWSARAICTTGEAYITTCDCPPKIASSVHGIQGLLQMTNWMRTPPEPALGTQKNPTNTGQDRKKIYSWIEHK